MAEKQTILGRMTQLAKANINALLDRAEDPQKMLDQMVRDYTNSIAEAQDAVAVTVGNLRLAEADYKEDVNAAREWGQKALAASRKADEMRGSDELKRKRDELVARQKSAAAQNRVQDAISSINVLDPTNEISRYEEQVRRQEALALGKAEVAAVSLEEQFAALEDHSADIEIEARLAALKSDGVPAQIEAKDFTAY